LAGLKAMEWDDVVWDGLRAAVTPMPPAVREDALAIIIAASEANAGSRGSELVEAKDLLKAAEENIPEGIREICLESLAEHGVIDES
jgi:hypothetical protein